MGMKGGRKPLPDAIKLIRGTRKERMNPDAPVYGDEVQVPAHFDERLKGYWFEIVPKLIRSGVAKEIDVYALEQLVEKWADWRMAQDKLNETGLVTPAPSGYMMMNPYYTITMQLGKEIRALMVEFGMTPSSRTRVTGDDSGKKDKNKFSDLS